MSDRPRRRATAMKLKITDLLNGDVVDGENGSTAIEVRTGDTVNRARILGEITSKFDSEADERVILDVDDTTGVIKVRGGGTEWGGSIYLKMRELKEGTTVDIVGLVRQGGDGNIYLECEVCIQVTDPAIKVLRDLEISKYYARKGLGSEATESIEQAIKGQATLLQDDEVKDQIIELLKQPDYRKNGCSFDDIKQTLGLSTKELEPALRALQGDGDIFEPKPGVFKYV